MIDVIYDETPCGVTLPFLDTKCKGHFTHETEGHFKHSHWWKTWSRTKFASHYAWGKSTWIHTWHQMDLFSWSLGLFSQNHLLEIGLPQNRETMALRNLITLNLLYCIMCEDSTWIEIHWKWHLVEGRVKYDFTPHLRAHDHITWFWKCLGMAFGHFFGALTISWSWLLVHVWSGPKECKECT